MPTRFTRLAVSAADFVSPASRPGKRVAHIALLVGLVASFVIGLIPQAQAAESSRPNILFILVDDLGFGDVGAFFQNERAAQADRSRPWHRTPGLDRLAAEGMQLPHHYCPAPVCAPSRASLLLGVHQGHANVRDNQFDKELENNHNLATVLKGAGYRTFAVGKYGLQGGQEREEITPPNWPAHPNRRGFDEYYGYIRHRDGHEHYPKEGIHRGAKEVWENSTEVSAGLDRCYTTDLFTARAKHAITGHVRETSDQPFFMYLAYDTPHAVLSLPTQAYPEGGGLSGGLQWSGQPGQMINTASGTPDSYYHPDYAEATWDHDSNPSTPEVAWPDVQKRYATVVRRIDDSVLDLLALFRDLGIDDNTLIVFTNDNGPSIESYLPENYQPTFFQGYGPYAGIKRDLWEGGVHVGALVRWPAHIRGGGTSRHHATAFWDWMPTFAEAAGVATPARSDGVSLLPLLTGHPDRQLPSTIYSEYFQPGRTPRFADFDPSKRNRQRNQMQLIREDRFVGVRYDIQTQDDDFEIYDIVSDPGQTTDLAASLTELQSDFQRRVLRLRRPNESAKRPYDTALIPALTAAEIVQSDRSAGVDWVSQSGPFQWTPRLLGPPAGRAADPAVGIATALATAKRAGTDSPADAASPPRLAVSITGLLEVPEDGEYTFTLVSKGRGLLRFHETTVIDADSLERSDEPVTGTINLQAGKHPIRLDWLEPPGGVTGTDAPLIIRWSGPGLTPGPIPNTAFGG